MTGFFLVVSVMLFYFLPSLVSGFRHHHNDSAIFVLNLLLGWTILGWIIALIWAFTGSPAPVVVRSVPSSPSAPAPAGFCPGCGAARGAGAFCPGCGAKLA